MRYVTGRSVHWIRFTPLCMSIDGRVKVRENQRVINKAIYLALGVDMDGQKELLGLWIAQNEGAKFWLAVFTELQHRGLKDIFIACMDGLTGLPEAIETLYPQTRIQLCMVHMVRNSLKYVSYKHRKEVAADLKLIYSASTEGEAQVYLELFAEKWDQLYPTISKMWHARLLSRDPLVCLSRRYSQGDLHHQRDRVRQHDLTQGDAQSADFPF
jgi:transposase-like protein